MTSIIAATDRGIDGNCADVRTLHGRLGGAEGFRSGVPTIWASHRPSLHPPAIAHSTTFAGADHQQPRLNRATLTDLIASDAGLVNLWTLLAALHVRYTRRGALRRRVSDTFPLLVASLSFSHSTSSARLSNIPHLRASCEIRSLPPPFLPSTQFHCTHFKLESFY